MRPEKSLMDESNSGFMQRALQRIKPTGTYSTNKLKDARAAQKAAQKRRRETSQELKLAHAGDEERAAVRQDGLEVWPLPGLAPMTRLRTTFGDVPAIALRKGDEVLTRDETYMRIEWLNRIHLDVQILQQKPDCNPIVLVAGSLGAGAPHADIMLSPRQIICADPTSELSSDREAAMLISRRGIRRLRETSLSYTVLHVGQPAELYCEGVFLRFPMEA